MAHGGYIKLYRRLADSSLWLGEKFTPGQAWVDLLLLAQFKDGHIRIRGNRVELKRGQVGWSMEKLSERWLWSRARVKRFLDELEMDGQIAQQKNYVSTVLTITNYATYQQRAQQTLQQTNSRQRSRRTADVTADSALTKKEKNVKKDKNDKKILGDNHERFISLWNSTTGAKHIHALNDKRRTSLDARISEKVKLRDGSSVPWLDALALAVQKFPLPCTRGDPNGWQPDGDWILRPDSVLKILEGKYDWTKRNGKQPEPTGVIHNPDTASQSVLGW